MFWRAPKKSDNTKYYEILGVSKNASQEDLEKAYRITKMELDECEETTLHDVNIEEEMRRKQQQQAQEAYEEDDDMHGGAQRGVGIGVGSGLRWVFESVLDPITILQTFIDPSTTPDHPSEESSAIPSGALVSVVVGDRRRESTMPRSLEPYQAAFNSTLFSGTDSCLVDELFVRFFASHRTVDNSFAGN
nr:DnaJ protein homolog [Ipomoea batatas]